VETYKKSYLKFGMSCMEIFMDEFLNYGMSNYSY
jgi:hypothetical protein